MSYALKLVPKLVPFCGYAWEAIPLGTELKVNGKSGASSNHRSMDLRGCGRYIVHAWVFSRPSDASVPNQKLVE